MKTRNEITLVVVVVSLIIIGSVCAWVMARDAAIANEASYASVPFGR